MPDGRKHAKAAQKAKWRACSNYELHQTAFQGFLRSDIELARPTLQINIFSHGPIINQVHSFYFQNSFSKSTVFESTTLQQLQQLHGSCSMPVFPCFPCGGVSPSSIDFPDDVGTWSWKGDRNVRAPWLSWFLPFSCYSHAQLQKQRQSWWYANHDTVFTFNNHKWDYIYYMSMIEYEYLVMFLLHDSCTDDFSSTIPASKKLLWSGRFRTIFSGHPSRAVGDPWWRSNSRDKMSKCKICPSG